MRSIRRSHSTVGLLAVAFLVAASACGSDDTDQLVSPPAPDTTDITEPGSTWAPTDNGPFETVRVVTSTPVVVSPPFDASVEGSGYVPVQWLVPWEDGFLAAGVRFAPQPLPDKLPPEIAELFPPEVTALFPDGLPPTQQEAIDILTEAGLLDVVMDILDEHPDAMDAVQSEPQPEPELVAAWSEDGDTWTPSELAQPDGLGLVSLLSVFGGRLTVAGTVPAADGEPWITTVASTTDLENWDTVRLPLEGTEAPPEPEDTETAMSPQTWASPVAVAADDEHWVVRVMIADDTDGRPEPRNEQWSAAWGDEPVMSEADQTSWILQSTSDGFLELGEDIRYSPDGRTWTDVTEPVPEVGYQTTAPFADGVLAIAGTFSSESSFSSSILALDATGNRMAEVSIPGLGDEFATWGASSSPAFIVQREAASTTIPDLWLLATTDGETWLLQDLDDGDAPEEIPMPGPVAINGTTVLVGSFTWEPDSTAVWQRFEITG
jgi:hypothetical protein